jgi:putative ABC transport system permease protein
VGDIRVRGLERESEPQVYLAYKQVPDGSIWFYVPKELVIRSTSDAAPLAAAVRRIVRKADPELPIGGVRTLQEVVDADTAPRQTQLRLLGAFAALALLLAGIGIHGLLSFAVSQRRPEFGLRRALGARSGDILRMVLREGIVLAAAGSALGVFLANAAGHAMEALLAGVPPGDTLTLLAAATVALLMTVSGSLVPAIRAVRVDPTTALRVE